MLSVRSWRTSRPRPAPSAAQTANVRWRLTPRASSNPATLMQAISRTSAVAAVSAARAGRYSPTISSRSGITRTRFCESPEGRPLAPPVGSRSAAPSMRCRMARTSVAACPAETPSRSRPGTRRCPRSLADLALDTLHDRSHRSHVFLISRLASRHSNGAAATRTRRWDRGRVGLLDLGRTRTRTFRPFREIRASRNLTLALRTRQLNTAVGQQSPLPL